MAYAKNMLPRTAAYYSLNGAVFSGSDLVLEAGGYAEISISHQMLPKLTSKMLVVVHPSIFSNYYVNDAVQVNISVILLDGSHLEYLVSASETSSGVFNVELDFPEEEFSSFTYRISSAIPVTVYNWELCSEEAIDVTTVIDGVEQSLPKLLYDYNTYSYAVAQNEITVGLISCYLLDATDLQGHFTISFFATERCNVHVRIKDNGVTELYTPLVYTVEKGYASISVPHAYLKKLATTHAFVVTMQCTNGQLSIPVRGILYTIDGGYLATRLLDAGMDIQDISIKQLSTDSTPSEIYAIGFEGTRLVLKSRVYSHLQRVNWTAIKDFGEGLTAGVEFYGRWAPRSSSDKYTIETESAPFVFILGLDNVLRVYSGDSFDTVYELDTDVTAIGACQGFNSMYYIEQDQGLVIAYVKEGNVYYRQWLYDDSSASYRWFAKEPVYEEGDASFVSMHRLPDYRLGICVQHASGTKWLITDRTYVSQAIKPELVTPYMEGLSVTTVRELSIADIDYSTATVNTFEEGPVYHNGFVMTFPTKLKILADKTIEDFKRAVDVYINGTIVADAIKTLSVKDNVVLILLKEDVRGGKTVKLDYNFYFLVGIMPNNCYVETIQSYTWLLPLPTYRTSHNEEVHIGVDGTLDATIYGLTTHNITQGNVESVSVIVDSTLDVVIHQLTTHKLIGADEEVNISVDGSIEVTISLVGTSPI